MQRSTRTKLTQDGHDPLNLFLREAARGGIRHPARAVTQLGCGYVYAWKIKAPDRLIEESGCFYILDKFAQVLCCGFAPSRYANGLLDGHKMPIEQTRTG